MSALRFLFTDFQKRKTINRKKLSFQLNTIVTSFHAIKCIFKNDVTAVYNWQSWQYIILSNITDHLIIFCVNNFYNAAVEHLRNFRKRECFYQYYAIDVIGNSG